MQNLAQNQSNGQATERQIIIKRILLGFVLARIMRSVPTLTAAFIAGAISHHLYVLSKWPM